MATRKLGWRTLAATVLCALSLVNIVADLLDEPVIKGLASASAISPLPKVFSDVRGLETFASEFTIEATTPGQEPRLIPITPELYARLAGPYNRRNVYGAALAYAPRLPDNLWQAVYCFALGPGGPLRSELDLPADSGTNIAVIIKTRTKGRQDTWRLDPKCSR
jgi:hypothetical protein